MKSSLRRGVIVSAIGLGASIQVGGAAAQQPAAAPEATFAFTEPAPLDFTDHEGYVSLFDGKSLKGWDGNPKFWRVENGAIVGESTPQQSERQQLHRVPGHGGEGLHAEVRDQDRRRRAEAASSTGA